MIEVVVSVVLIVAAVAAVIVALVRDPDDLEPVRLESPSASRAPRSIDKASRRPGSDKSV